MRPDSSITFEAKHDLVLLEIAVRDDADVVPFLGSAIDWLRTFPAAAARTAAPWWKHYRSAAEAAVVALTSERLRLDREHAAERARFAELTTRAESFRAAGQSEHLRRTLELRIAARRSIELLVTRLAQVRDEAVALKASLGPVARN